MSSYGTSFAEMATHAKDVVRHAFYGEVWAGEDEHGDLWAPAGADDCEDAALEEVDNLYYHLDQMASAARAYERLCKDHGWDVSLGEYAHAKHEEMAKSLGEYVYEQDLREAMWDE